MTPPRRPCGAMIRAASRDREAAMATPKVIYLGAAYAPAKSAGDRRDRGSDRSRERRVWSAQPTEVGPFDVEVKQTLEPAVGADDQMVDAVVRHQLPGLR